MAEIIGGAVLLALGWAAFGIGGVLLAALVLAVVWVVSRLFWPYRRCPRCKGTGRNAGSNERRHGDCKKCHHTGRVRRFGAGHVHRAKLSVLGRRK